MLLRTAYYILLVSYAQAQQPAVVTFREGSDTVARGINNQGQIAGYFTPAGSTLPRGFVRAADGTIQTVLLPGKLDTRIHGINDQGDVVGTHDLNTHAFLRSADGTVTEITVADATTVTANGINSNGFVVGAFQKPNTNVRAYLRNLAAEIVPLADIFTGDLEAVAIANNTNQIALMRTTSGFGVIYTNTASGNFVNFAPNLPGQGPGQYLAHGIAANGVIVGEVSGRGFLMRGNTDGAIFALPNANATIAYGINDRNQIAGATRDSANTQSGFLLNPCSPVIAESAQTHGSGTEAGSIDVQADGLCVWVADSNVPWITFTRSIGNGSGAVVYSLAANTGPERQGKITIGTREVLITQASGDCHYTVSPLFIPQVPSAGGRLTFNIATTPGCAWSFFTPDPWVRFLSVSGSITAALTLQVDPIPPEVITTRTTVLNIAGSTVNVTQAPLPCDVQLSRTSVISPPEGSLENIRVTVRPQCGWNPLVFNSWVSILGQFQNQGPGTLSLSIARNLGTSERITLVAVATNAPGATVLPSIAITQRAAVACSYSLPQFASGATAPAEGFTNSFILVAGENCPYTASSSAPWLIVSTPQPGSLTVSYQVLPNASPFPRRGTISVAGLVFTVDQLGNTSLQLSFVPLPACRIMDTRPGQGLSSDQGPPALVASQTRALGVAGRCGVPQNARAYVLNVTALPVNSLPFLTVWNFNQPRPFASTLNSFNGRTVSNLTVIPAGNGSFPGAVAFFALDTTNVVVDVMGYFADSASNSLVLYPVAPCRVLDTRTNNSPLIANTSRDVPVAGTCGIPATAAAFSLNATAVSRGRLDSLTIWPAGTAKPLASPVNLAGGQVVANASLLAAGTGGAISALASQDTDFVLDVNGYFAPPSDAGLYFYTLTPCRMADTRQPNAPALAPGVPRTFVPSASACGIPGNARAHLVNATVVPPAPLAFLSLFPAPSWTGSSTLNAFDGQVTANFAIVPDNGPGIGAQASGATDLILDISGYFAPVPAALRRPVPLP